MGGLIVVEGLDGAGKRTLSAGLVEAWRAAGARVATLAFPRYGRSIHADLGAEALRGQHGDTASSVEAMALLWALDRRDAADELRKLLAANDIVLLDRYVASNAAYTAARRHEDAAGPSVEWIRNLEYERFALPVPDLQVLLRVPVALAAERARSRAESDAARERDAYERDGDLQYRTGEVYDGLAQRHWMSRWIVAGAETDTQQLAVRISNLLHEGEGVTR
ncbi:MULTISPECIES: dTMP kinase [unclassified Rhodococcus (in: high G+C Gram-positive bacteria)]|uniref:dTMP kinase n=1 Tax=unclassified Rhodococcus (in: high G+C Gram-positive bacteria) TaxID=192944 RepID=UPI00146CE666|nr:MULTISPECIES: dTMP kinase [unclassified Rhodococcus (in: high G+C Gram-positive bacteria)]MBF0663335.1 dTMP kinase [Rhodococcus sp. (in: high G+C Gram-positive bacteria)]NME78396.1 dTMP kinase [Rhodococcus sp. 105337]